MLTRAQRRAAAAEKGQNEVKLNDGKIIEDISDSEIKVSKKIRFNDKASP